MVHNVHRQAAVKNGVFELPAFTLKEHLGYCVCACVYVHLSLFFVNCKMGKTRVLVRQELDWTIRSLKQIDLEAGKREGISPLVASCSVRRNFSTAAVCLLR